MTDPKTPAGTELLIEYRLSQMERAVTTLVEQNTTMIALEQRHMDTREALDRAFKAIKEHDAKHQAAFQGVDTRVRTIETEMPTLRLVRGWVIAGMLAVIAASGAVVTDTVRKAGQAPAVQQSRTG